MVTVMLVATIFNKTGCSKNDLGTPSKKKLGLLSQPLLTPFPIPSKIGPLNKRFVFKGSVFHYDIYMFYSI